MRTERSDLHREFAATAEKLALRGDHPGRALLLLVEEADRLYASSRRRPTLAQVLNHLRAVNGDATRDRSTAECDLVEATGRAREARVREGAAGAAVQYLEASCA